MILASSKGRAVYEDYLAREKTFLTVPERRTIVFVVVEAMVNEIGLYPTTQEKDLLAAAIIQAFPCLGIRDGNNLIHSHYYHAKSGGFIETLLKTMRKKQPECRKRKMSLKQKIHRRIPRGYIDDCGPELEEEEIQMHEFMVKVYFLFRVCMLFYHRFWFLSTGSFAKKFDTDCIQRRTDQRCHGIDISLPSVSNEEKSQDPKPHPGGISTHGGL